LTTAQVQEIRPKLLVEGWIPPPLERDFTVIGKPIDRLDAPEKVTGKAKYAGDLAFPGMLHAKILRSPYPHAKITRIDIRKAKEVAGVRAILTKDNTPGWYTYWYRVPQPAFPEVVSFVGQEVAAVAAETVDAAREALRLIEVEYEPLPAVFDAEEAMRPGAPQVTVTDLPNPEPSGYGPTEPNVGNIYSGKPAILTRGDIKAGFQDADIIVEKVYRTPSQHQGTLQTRACVTDWNGDTLTVHESCQGVWQTKKDLAWSLKLPPERVNVKVRYMGGGFGSKAGAQRYVHYASRLSMETKRPVRLELTRAEEFVSHPRRPSLVFYLKTGVKKDGTLTAMYGKAIANIGAGGAYRSFINQAIGLPFLLYKCPNAFFEQWGVHTNLQYTGPTRSPLTVSSCSCVEAHIDEVADAVGLDPLEFRLKNYTPYADQVKLTPFSSKKLDVTMRKVTGAIGWARRETHAQVQNITPKKRGIGMASYIFQAVGINPCKANAEVVIRKDGSIELHAAIVEIGSGAATALAMIAAEELGVRVEDVNVMYGDSEAGPFAPGTHASRMIPEMGPAVLQAAADARRKLFEAVAVVHKTDASQLHSTDGWLYIGPSKRIRFKDAGCLLKDDVVVGKGSRARNPGSGYPVPRAKPEGGGENPVEGPLNFATWGASATEVEVDEETGEVRVLRVATAHEFGRALNPKFCDSQHYGGVVFGMGMGLLEEPILDRRSGIMLNTDFHQYRMPTSLDMPLEIVPFNVEGDDDFFAYSAKGGGEGTNSAIPAAIRNAIHNAVGVWIYEYPITRERVLAALAQREA
jgi:CO/xanthine dehydrogenase Mo-binding subunit